MNKIIVGHLKNFAAIVFLFFIFTVIFSGYKDANQIKKEADKYDSINQRAKRAQQRNGVQRKNVQNRDSINRGFRCDCYIHNN